VRAVLLLLSAIKLVLEIAGLALVGQALLYVLAGEKRDRNFFYQALRAVASPFTWVARRITPSLVAERHVPFVAFFLIVIGWVLVTFQKIQYCLTVGVQACR
jgi:hypothetical protein